MKKELNFKNIYEEFYAKIRRYLSRFADAGDAEDMAQEVFEKVHRHLDGFKGAANISTWIYRIATHTALDRLRSPAVKRKAEFLPLDTRTKVADKNMWTGQANRSTDQILIREEMNQCIREHVDALPPDAKTVLILKDLEGFRNREIADILNISSGAVKTRLHRARARLKKSLDAGCRFYYDQDNVFSCDRKEHN